MLVDIFARQKNRQPEFRLVTFFGQLQHIFCIRFVEECPQLGLNQDTVILLATIKTCVVTKNTVLEQLDMHPYSRSGALDFVDIKNIQCLVGRVLDRDQWTIVD